MEPRSLAWRTDLALLLAAGSEVDDRGDHLVVRTPANPGFYWGNFLLLDVPAGERSARMTEPPDRMESAGAAFHAAVAEGFRTLAAAEPDRWLVVDGTGEVLDVFARVVEAVERWEGGRP